MLERAAAANKPGTTLRQRAELEIQRIEFPVFPLSAFDRLAAEGAEARYRQGDLVTWSGQLGRRYLAQGPEVVIEWCDPTGDVVRHERLRPGTGGGLTSRLQTRGGSPVGRWTLRVLLAGTAVEERGFELAPRE